MKIETFTQEETNQMMKSIKDGFDNQSGLKFIDISSEHYREYDWGDGRKIRIEQPIHLNVSASGGHRVWDEENVSHYIPKGWIHLSWSPKNGQPNFVK